MLMHADVFMYDISAFESVSKNPAFDFVSITETTISKA